MIKKLRPDDPKNAMFAEQIRRGRITIAFQETYLTHPFLYKDTEMFYLNL
jgi:hypothetical protein